MFTLQPMDLIALFVLVCLLMALIEALAPTPASKLALQVSLLMAVIGWVGNAFHMTGAVERVVLSWMRTAEEFDLIAWLRR